MPQRFLTVGAAFAIFIAGCGDDQPSSAPDASVPTAPAVRTTTPDRIGKAEYVQRVERLCADGKTTADKANERLQQIVAPATPAAFARGADFMDKQLVKERAQFRKVEAVPIPSGDAAAVAAYLRPLRDGHTVARLISDALRDGDAARITSLSAELDRLRDRQRGAADGYGFKVCGRR